MGVTSILSTSFVDNYFEIAKNLDIFTTLYKQLNTFYVDETNAGDLMKKGIDEMLKSLDPYTTYIQESEMEDFRFQTTGQYGGIGAMITKVDDYVLISEPYENFPAQKAGLLAGDKILEINGVSAKGKTTKEVSKVLKGQPNTSVTILVERPYVNNPFEVSFERKKISVPSISYSEYLQDGIAYIRLRSFTRKCANDLKNTIINLKKEQELKGLILDLRSNPGGLLNESVDIVNLFVEKGEEVVKDVLEKFTSKVGQFVEVMDIEEFGHALFIDHEIQVAEKDEKIYSSNFFKSSYDLSKKNNNVAIIGGGDGGVARACLENNSNYIDWFELDPEIVDACYRHLPRVCSKVKKSNKVKTFWGDAFKSIKEIEDSKYYFRGWFQDHESRGIVLGGNGFKDWVKDGVNQELVTKTDYEGAYVSAIFSDEKLSF